MNKQRDSWRFMLLARELSWWIWLATACALCIGLSGHIAGFLAAIVLTGGQTIFLLLKGNSFRSSAIQTRVAYTVLLIICFVPTLRWLYWVPTIGTLALLLWGYCLMARFLSLLPWNLTEPISAHLLQHTFLTPPRLAAGGRFATNGCPGGLCSIEAQLGQLNAAPLLPTNVVGCGIPQPAAGHRQAAATRKR